MINNIAFTLNIIALLMDIFTCSISFVVLIIIIHHVYFNRLNQDDKVVISLCVTIYPVIFLFTAIAISFHIQTLLGDLYQQDFNSTRCIPIGYISYVLLNMFYWGFINQAFYRLSRIVYSTHRWLQYFWLYIILSPIEMIFSCILLSPILVWHGITYLTTEYYCYVRFTHTGGILWLAFGIYGISISLLTLIYVRITIFLRGQVSNQARAIKQRQERDLLVIQRILITVGILMILGISPIIFLIMAQITHEDYFLAFRVIWPFISLTMIGSSLSLIILTPQLKGIILARFAKNQITPIHGTVVTSLQMRHNIAT